MCHLQENAGTSLLEAFSVKEIDTHLGSLSISQQARSLPPDIREVLPMQMTDVHYFVVCLAALPQL